jgi:predicted secreted hydrolase
MRGRGLVIGVAVVLVGLAAGVVYVTRDASLPSNAAPTVKVAEALGGPAGGTAGYARALEPRPFHFPEDHGPHPDFRTEWWYWTGNLSTADGRDFGYQFTFFRSALAPEDKARTSAWGTRQLYMGHLAISDIGGGRFHAFERFSRGALGLAGAQAEPFKVWLEDWSAEDAGNGAMRLTARGEGVSLSLVLEPGKPAVLQGDRGLSQKGPKPGDASYYYSFTRMPSRGQVTVDGRAYEVTGQSWMDREWGTDPLGGRPLGWDWFALQLSDGGELMYGQLRHPDGTVDAHSAGILVPAQGEPVRLSREDVRLEVLDTWKSPHSGATYPARWRLAVPSRDLTLELTPALANQELLVSVRYWEGAVRLSGSHAGAPVEGRGYVELTGYGDAPGRGR